MSIPMWVPPTGEPGESEYSWGPGLCPPGLEDEPPSRGGLYRPIAPPTEAPTPGGRHG